MTRSVNLSKIMEVFEEKLQCAKGRYAHASSACSSILDPKCDTAIRLDWRLDPSRSLADHAIIVPCSNGNENQNHRSSRDEIQKRKKTYNVHRVMLTTGERKSGYFVKIFATYNNNKSFDKNVHKNNSRYSLRLSPSMSSNSSSVFEENNLNNNFDDVEQTVLNFPNDSMADAFPLVLDYIYDGNLNALNAHTAPALLQLSNFLDIRKLHERINSFIHSDMHNISSAVIYFCQADAVKDRELLTMALKTCAENISRLSPNDLGKLTPNQMNRLISSPHSTCTSETLSVKVADYLKFQETTNHDSSPFSNKIKLTSSSDTDTNDAHHLQRPFQIHAEMFYFLTHAQVLPRISPDVAIYFLSYTVSKFPNALQDETLGGEGSSLMARCLRACTENWQHSILQTIEARQVDSTFIPNANNSQNMHYHNDQGYNSLPSDLKITLLESALLAAKLEMQQS
eukprot:CAMPEP_0184869804 /NCGR_PEP_ID=MMETSP0580-20130426/35360_1 /TAXON_ID=1118495 /ORGANISM="Dactyliosolen fragilissimus" /LENGTH=454 /DNA_ID=CAMNT_0027371531 /DNA_START=19 /DNA_END=1380 /DNA_ORIENTATION=-